ncbi:chymotrypsin-1-like [Anopheles maculipalpis]|uniref:chymotrypsin-1-like n=1 Tax=Anopheles maculipalpis TaxID=1496333 RepID=UPI002158A69D|nr:chymotrypsin-1-like [Anopheles maculipalpis]
MIHTMTLLVTCICGGIFGAPSFAINPIIGGIEAKEGAAPYQASLQFVTRQGHKHFCGGSIIGDRWILTAKHCVVKTKPYCVSVLVGTNDKERGGTRYSVDRLFPHDFLEPDSINDIALVRLATPLKLTKRVKIIKYSKAVVPENATLTITGWGEMLKGDGRQEPANKLQTLNVRHIALDRCRAIFSTPNTTDSSIINDSDLCTVGLKKHQGTCAGDSGSPVIWKGEQVGIVSRGIRIGHCALGFPDIQTRVPFYHDWIQKTIADNSD